MNPEKVSVLKDLNVHDRWGTAMAYKKGFYNLDSIRSIPILDVCDYLGIDVVKRGKNYWCKVRPENQASVVLHPDRNTFYDFGNQQHGNNIGLVQYARGVSAGEAIRLLADGFDIAPTQSKEDLLIKPLNMWEYQKIGLHGDMATKNLVFPVTIASTDELLDMEYAYKMPMNMLRKKDPKAYRWILENKAIPYVENKRQLYFLSVWNHYDFLHSFGHHVEFFNSEKTCAKFEKATRDLEQSEWALYKACYGTGLAVAEPQRRDPLRVWSHLVQGKLEISLGPFTREEIEKESANLNCRIVTKEISYDTYCSLHLDGHPHAAIFNTKAVTMLYPETDRDYFDCLTMSTFEKPQPSLDFKMDMASRRSSSQVISGPPNKSSELMR